MKVLELLHDERLDALPCTYDRESLLKATTASYVIHQDVSYEYSRPIRNLRQRLVILPRRRYGDQRRVAESFDVLSPDPHDVRRRRDSFGNVVVGVTAPRVKAKIEFRVRSVVVRDIRTAGAPWHAPAPTRTHMTEPTAAISDAVRHLASLRDDATIADAVSELVNDAFTYSHDVTTVRTTAAQAWDLRQGVCQDMAHVMVAMCASLGVPARYVSGHMVGDGASHAWVEVFDRARRQVVAIDPTHRRRTDLRYVTTATGRDYADVAPVTGSYTASNAVGHLTVRKRIRFADLS